MNLTKSSLLLFGSRIIKSITSFAAVIIFSRELGASPLGTYYPFIALIGLLAIPADFGISTAVQKRISEDKNADLYLGAAIVMKLPILIIIITLIWMSKGHINQFLGEDIAALFIITLLFDQIGGLSISVLRGELRVGETALISVLRPISWLIIGYILYIQRFGIYALVYGYLIGTILIAVVGWWRVSISVLWPNASHIRSLLDYGRFSVISSVGGYFYSWMDVAILSAFVATGIASTRGEIGAYENAWRISLIVMMLTQSISVTLFPQISQWDSKNATDRIESVIPIALLPGALLIIPGFVGIAVLSSDLLRILFGEEFTVAWLALIILSGEKFFQSVHSIFGNVLQGIDRPDLAAYSTVAAASVNLVLNIILIWMFGIVGAALATTTASLVRAVMQMRYLDFFLDVEYPVQEIVASGIASIIMGMLLYVILNHIQINNIIGLSGIIIVGILIYTPVILLFSSVRNSIRSILRPVLSQISAI